MLSDSQGKLKFPPVPYKRGWFSVFLDDQKLGALLWTPKGYTFLPIGGGIVEGIKNPLAYFANYQPPKNPARKQVRGIRRRKGHEENFSSLHISLPKDLFLDFKQYCYDNAVTMGTVVEEQLRLLLYKTLPTRSEDSQ